MLVESGMASEDTRVDELGFEVRVGLCSGMFCVRALGRDGRVSRLT